MSSRSAVEDVVTILKFLLQALICHAPFSPATDGSRCHTVVTSVENE